MGQFPQARKKMKIEGKGRRDKIAEDRNHTLTVLTEVPGAGRGDAIRAEGDGAALGELGKVVNVSEHCAKRCPNLLLTSL